MFRISTAPPLFVVVSMLHRRISMPIPFQSSLLLCGLLHAFAVGAAFGQGGPATVVVAPVIERQVAPRQSFVANVKPRRQSVIGSAVDGRVQEFMVDAGQAVQQGQSLAQLRTKTIEIELAAAEAERDLRKAELAELKNGSRPEEIALAEAAARGAQAANEYEQARLQRAERLFKNGTGLSQDEFESARAAATAALERVAETESSLKLVKEGPRNEQIEQAAARLAVQEQIVEGLRDRVSKYTVKSPFQGFVSSELTEAGAWVKQGDPIAEVVEIDPVEVEVLVPESSVQFVRKGDAVEVRVEAYGNRVFPGTIDQIIPLADNRSRTFPVRILVQNPPQDSQHDLLPGMLARASLPSGPVGLRVLVPKDALQLGGPTPVLMKVNKGKAMVVPVRTGPTLSTWIAVESLTPGAIEPGDLVVTRGNERLRPGQDIVVSQTQPALALQTDE
ncbi:MAG: efflux RND transporter periplasmic adaptor subunit [Pirellulaceae bacterium]|nr:efflux RND transporter periplasmic adaptor subunit [Pirellulaceae bacterium]